VNRFSIVGLGLKIEIPKPLLKSLTVEWASSANLLPLFFKRGRLSLCQREVRRDFMIDVFVAMKL